MAQHIDHYHIDMSEESGVNKRQVQSALYCMALLSRLKGQKVDNALLKRYFGHFQTMGINELIRAYGDLGLKAKSVKLNRRRLRNMPLPGIVIFTDGDEEPTYAVLHRVQGKIALLHLPGLAEPKTLPLDELVKGCTKEVILLTNAQANDKINDESKFGMRWFFKTLFKYGGVMREAIVASFVIQIFALATPLFFMVIIDKVFAHNNLATLDVLVFALIVVSVFDVLLNGLRTYVMSHTTSRVDLELGIRLFKHMMALPLSYFESRRTGDTVARMREAETIRGFLTGSTLTVMIDLFFVIVFLAVMWLFSKTLALVVIAAMPVFFLVSAIMTPLMRSKLEDKHKKQDDNQSFLLETIGGMESVKSASVEPQQQREWEDRLADFSKSSFHSSNLGNLINQGTSFISKTLTIVLLYFGAKLVLAGELSVGQLIAFNMLTGRVIAPIQRLAQIWQEFTGMKVAVKRLADILDSPTEPIMMMNKTELPPLEGAVQFEKVSFKYDDEKPTVIEDVSFSIAPGEVVGVVGSTGSGKTTLVKLLQRLYVPTSGRVSIDGINLASIDGAWLRDQIGVVAQDFVLFNRSIRDNITLSDTTIEDAKVIEVAKLVGAHDMIMRLPEGYDTQLNERGRGLSTGQRQSIALARALVNDPVILILDEATSALDYESEQRFQGNFRAITSGRTTFVVAHRLSTVRHADRIITLEDGHLEENDSPDKLLLKGGRFAALHAIHQSTWESESARLNGLTEE